MSIERIVLAMDPSPASQAACICAVELAAALRVELVGMFIEDTALFRSAALPVTREIGVATGRQRPLNLSSLEAQLRIHALRTRELLELAAATMNVATSFWVSRTRASVKRKRRLVHGAVRAVLDDPKTAGRVAAAGETLAAHMGLPLERIEAATELDIRLASGSGPIVMAASSSLATDSERLARVGCESGAMIALVEPP